MNNIEKRAETDKERHTMFIQLFNFNETALSYTYIYILQQINGIHAVQI